MANFTFNSESHSYLLDGVRLPSYSQVAKAEGLSDYSGVNEVVMEASRKFGDAGHKMLQLWVPGNLDEESLDENLVPYLNGVKKFFSLHKVEPITEWIEKPTFSAKRRYGIKPDLFAYIDGTLTVIEWKFTASIMPCVAIQTAAQKVAFEEQTKLKVKQRWAMRVMANDYRLVKFTESTDEAVWFSVLNTFTWRANHKLIKEEIWL